MCMKWSTPTYQNVIIKQTKARKKNNLEPTSTPIWILLISKYMSTDFRALVTPPAVDIWLSFIITISNKPIRWFRPPPINTCKESQMEARNYWKEYIWITWNSNTGRRMIYTAHLSTKRKPGAVFLVSRMYAGFAASAMAYMSKRWCTIGNIERSFPSPRYFYHSLRRNHKKKKRYAQE